MERWKTELAMKFGSLLLDKVVKEEAFESLEGGWTLWLKGFHWSNNNQDRSFSKWLRQTVRL